MVKGAGLLVADDLHLARPALQVAEGEPAVDPLIDGVAGVRWRFVLNGRRLDAWPPDNARTDLLPQGVEIEMELPDAGTITRLVALR